jgi:hypothetical protein
MAGLHHPRAFGVPVNLSGELPRVEHRGKCCDRILRGLGLAYRLICGVAT